MAKIQVSIKDLYSWGANGFGQLGDGTTTERLSPVQVPGTWSGISGGGSHSLALFSIEKEYNKNDNAGIWSLNEVYEAVRSDSWSDFIPTIDDIED